MHRLGDDATMHHGGGGTARTIAIVTDHRIGRIIHSSRDRFVRYLAQSALIILCALFFACTVTPVTTPITQTTPAETQTCGRFEAAPPELTKQPNYRQVALVVHPANDQLLPQLTLHDLTLYQGNKQLPISFFEPQPVTVGILVDTSGSMEPRRRPGWH
jgi:hypothetical protein